MLRKAFGGLHASIVLRREGRRGAHTGDVILCPYEEVEGVFVFAGALAWQRAVTFFERLQKTTSETFTTLLERFGK